MHRHYNTLLDFIERYNLASGSYIIYWPRPASLAYISAHIIEYSVVLSYNCALCYCDTLRCWMDDSKTMMTTHQQSYKMVSKRISK